MVSKVVQKTISQNINQNIRRNVRRNVCSLCLVFFMGSSGVFASGPIADARPNLYERNKTEQQRMEQRREWRGSRQNTSNQEEGYMLSTPYYGYGSGEYNVDTSREASRQRNAPMPRPPM